MHMQPRSAASRALLCCYFGLNSPPIIILSLRIPKMSEGGVSATSDSPPPLLFLKEKASITLSVRVDTLNFGTGKSVSLYLVQRRPILGSRTMSTGGIPGFCRRGRGGRGRWRWRWRWKWRWRGETHNTVIHPIHNFTRRELVAK